MTMDEKPDNPFHAKIVEIVQGVMKDEVNDAIETKMVDQVEATVEALLATKLASTVEQIIEKATPAIVAAELHNMLNGGEPRKLGPGGKVQAAAAPKKRRGNKGSYQPRKRCKKCKGSMRQTPPSSGKYECRKCDAGE